MDELHAYLVKHKDTLNLSDISRQAGMDSQYLKHIVANRRSLTTETAEKIREALKALVIDFPQEPSTQRCDGTCPWFRSDFAYRGCAHDSLDRLKSFKYFPSGTAAVAWSEANDGAPPEWCPLNTKGVA